ncbi:hypothetical protein AMST5_02453 [freshwater sediment metagenome]|jgi:opacity protein-like surface antigen|uniref:Uncharacterized protein n=1 Tax=freshwater sediment metagenome TaxID=556182 RepID=A0AA48M151_9ZZZZ
MKSILVAAITLIVVSSAFAQSARQNFNPQKQGAGNVGGGQATNPAPSSSRSSDPLKGLNVSKCCHDSPSGVVCKC